MHNLLGGEEGNNLNSRGQSIGHAILSLYEEISIVIKFKFKDFLKVCTPALIKKIMAIMLEG